MAHRRRRFVTALWVIAAVLCGVRGAAAQVVLADVNGDGVRDRIEAAPTGTELVVHTSHRHHPQRLRAKDHIVRVVISDVDRDGRVDIIVSTRRAGLQIWLNAGRGRFRSATPRTPVPDWRPANGAGGTPQSAANNDGADSLGAGLLTSARARAPTPDRAFRGFRSTAVTSSSRSARPRIPRGPPHVSSS